MSKFIICCLAIAAIGIFSACGSSSNTPNTQTQVGNNEYYSDAPMSVMEYKMYIADKVSSLNTILITRMNKIGNVADGSCSVESELNDIQSCIEDLKQDKVDLTYLHAPDDQAKTRELAIQYWQDAIDELNDISNILESGSISQETAMQIKDRLSNIATSIHGLTAR